MRFPLLVLQPSVSQPWAFRLLERVSWPLRQAGFDPHGAGYKLDLETLFRDWAEVARRVGKIPSLLEYSKHSRYSVGPAGVSGVD